MANFPLIPPQITRFAARLLRDRRGAAAVMLAIALTGIIGFAGLGTEVASWYFTQRAMQGAADFAATSAAAQLAAGTIAGSAPTSTQLTDTGRTVAAKFKPNFIDGDTSNTSVTVNNPPATTTNLSTCSSPFSSFNCYVEVLISQPQTGPRISSLFMSSGLTIATRAVARANTKAGDTGCVLALSGASISDVTLNGGVNMSFSNCALYDNSPLTSGNDALYMSNNASLTASAVYVVGNANNTSGITTADGPNGANSIYTGVTPAVDPYASVTMPTPSSCDQNSNMHNPSTTLGPSTSGGTYVFCGNVNMDANGSTPTLNLNPGPYIFACGSSLTMTSGTLNATGGVTLVFERACPGHNAASSPGVINVSGNANQIGRAHV